MKIYLNTGGRCMLCDNGANAFDCNAFYLVGSREAIAYTLCAACAPKTRAGLPPDDLRKLDAKLAAHAKSLGLTGTH
jgi:hypothetical protein